MRQLRKESCRRDCRDLNVTPELNFCILIRWQDTVPRLGVRRRAPNGFSSGVDNGSADFVFPRFIGCIAMAAGRRICGVSFVRVRRQAGFDSFPAAGPLAGALMPALPLSLPSHSWDSANGVCNCAVLGQPALTHLDVAELMLKNPKELLHICPDAGFQAFELCGQLFELLGIVPSPSVAWACDVLA